MNANQDMREIDSDDLVFADEPMGTHDEDKLKSTKDKLWKLMIIDDEEYIHSLTKVVLEDFSFNGKQLEIISAFSAKEACELLIKHTDTAVLLLDVIMETDHAGFDVVNYVREKLNNKMIRIILRTGQPGKDYENDIVTKYEIDDYKEKTDFSADKMNSTMITALRTYHEMQKLKEKSNVTDTTLEQAIQEKTQHLTNANEELKKIIASTAMANTKNISESEEVLFKIINSSKSIFYFKDADGRFVFTNLQFAEVFGLDIHNSFGKNELELLPPSISSQMIENDNYAIRSGIPRQFEEKYEMNNAVHLYAATKIPLIDAEGAVCGLCGIATRVEGSKD